MDIFNYSAKLKEQKRRLLTKELALLHHPVFGKQFRESLKKISDNHYPQKNLADKGKDEG